VIGCRPRGYLIAQQAQGSSSLVRLIKVIIISDWIKATNQSDLTAMDQPERFDYINMSLAG
jgi:hypothetical protein